MVLGKSTLGKIIAGLEKPTKGQVIIDELCTKDKKNFLEIRKKVGIVFQNPENQILFNNVYDDIAFTMKNLEIEISKERIEEALNITGMKNYIDKDAYELSLGQKQRITISGVIATNSKYIVLDEPTAMLDSQGKEDIYNMINELKRQGYTIIYITNVIDEVLMSDKILIIEDGKIIKEFLKVKIIEEMEFLKEHGIKISEIIELVSRLYKKGVKLDITNWTKKEIIEKIIYLLEGKKEEDN